MKQAFYIFLSICCFSCLQLSARGTGTWKSYMAYHETTAVAEAGNNVFAVANNSLYSFNPEDNSYRTYSREENGMNDTQIDTIAYNPHVKTLLIVYTNGNIDLYGEGGFYNIPYLMQITLPNKEINHIYFHKEYAYISAAFGIMVLNMEKREITDTYRIGDPVYSTCIHNNHIYATTQSGVCFSTLDQNLLDPQNWNPFTIEFTDGASGWVKQMVVFKDRLRALLYSNGIYTQQSGTRFEPFSKNKEIIEISVQNDKLVSRSLSRGYVWFSDNHTNFHALPTGTLYGISTLNDNIYWIASGENMLQGLRRKAGTERDYEWFVSKIRIDSPKRDYAFYMTFDRGRLWIAGGGRDGNAYGWKGTVMTYTPSSDSTQWFTLNHEEVAKHGPKGNFKDPVSIAIDPKNENHYFVSTWGNGLFEFIDNKVVNVYHHENSLLETDSKSNPFNYIRVDGLAFDKDNNLWMTNSDVNDGIKRLSPEGEWKSYSFGKYLYDQYIINKILITSSNHKWVNVLKAKRESDNGILVFDDPTDWEYYTSFNTRSTSDHTINPNQFYCVVEDHNGYVWVGTNLGPIYTTNPKAALTDRNSLLFHRIVRTDENGESILFMDGESVKVIAVDGANRKWLGTASSGVLLISEDGLETIEHFKTDNSPLPSNNIESIAIDPKTGEVFIGTDKGIVSYMGSATKGEESYSDVYAFPNPVRPEFQGEVTITGLMGDSDIKITDINGNVIKSGKSFGGQYVWDCRRANGQQVATGIYLVMAVQPDRGESIVTKIMVIK